MRIKPAALLAMVFAGLALAGCDNAKTARLQGWVEADLVFVSPGRAGPYRDAECARGRHGQQGDPLFTVDDDLQKADCRCRRPP